MYVGGNGGIKTEAAQFLCKVKTAEEVMEYSGAFIQIYREEARYLDRTVHWIERVGLDYVKKRVLEDAEGRKAAYERLLYALQGAVDPWAERVQKRAEHKEFETITV
jgi:nitrite reductase (NADH) large subunit